MKKEWVDVRNLILMCKKTGLQFPLKMQSLFISVILADDGDTWLK